MSVPGSYQGEQWGEEEKENRIKQKHETENPLWK